MQNGRTELPKVHTYAGHAGASKRLKCLHDTYSLSWPAIAALDEYAGIPPSTLRDIAKKGIVPVKWRHRFPGVGAIDDRPRRAVNLDNMQSTANTIEPRINTNQLRDLIQILREKLKRRESRH
ncbi:MAG: hypothetical protein ACYTFW_05115 [Planctomycetota bacterium]|jgi:hypothetical protein